MYQGSLSCLKVKIRIFKYEDDRSKSILNIQTYCIYKIEPKPNWQICAELGINYFFFNLVAGAIGTPHMGCPNIRLNDWLMDCWSFSFSFIHLLFGARIDLI